MTVDETAQKDREHRPDDPGPEDPRGPLVDVLYVNSLDEVKFHMPWTATLNETWARAYHELEEPRQEGDKFQCREGAVDLTPYLTLTLRQLRERHICAARRFQIAGPTGGAT